MRHVVVCADANYVVPLAVMLRSLAESQPALDALHVTVLSLGIGRDDRDAFRDPGTADTHTATVDWGDGTGVQTGVVSESPFGPPGSVVRLDGTISAGHIYEQTGTYQVAVCVADDDQPAVKVCDQLTVTVLRSTLPKTGSDSTNTLVQIGIWLLLLGAGITLTTRRRRRLI
jgi:LPXTG-motif cell wall-anchored protein